MDKVRCCASVSVFCQTSCPKAVRLSSSPPSHHLPSQLRLPELMEALLDNVNALPQLCLSHDERWSKPYLVPMGGFGQETILSQL